MARDAREQDQRCDYCAAMHKLAYILRLVYFMLIHSYLCIKESTLELLVPAGDETDEVISISLR